MNEIDKLRFARYRKGYVEPIYNDDKNDDKNNKNNTNKIKKELGYINVIQLNPDNLVSTIIKTQNKLESNTNNTNNTK